MLGTRPKDELEYIRSDQALQFLAGMPQKPKVPWSTLFPEASEKALDLMDRMLQFHPAKRITVDDAMAHPYFDSVRSQYVDPDPVLPTGPGASPPIRRRVLRIKAAQPAKCLVRRMTQVPTLPPRPGHYRTHLNSTPTPRHTSTHPHSERRRLRVHV